MADSDSMPVARACTKCSEVKPLSAFSKATGGKYGLSSRCRACAALYAKRNRDRINELTLARYHRLQEPIRQAKAAALNLPEKVCSKCLQSKPKDQFKKSKTGAGGLHCYCKVCCNERNREYNRANPDAAAASTAKWAKANKAKKEAQRQRWIERHPGRQTELAARWRKENAERHQENMRRYLSRTSVRVHRTIRSRLRSWIGKKEVRTFATIGYSLAELVAHLEKQFVKGMSWANYGAKWHIDHIVPLASFDVESIHDPLVKSAWCLSNLRPLWAKDNLKKHAKRIYLI